MVGKLLKGLEVAEILNVSKAFAYRMMAEGRIQTIKMGHSVRVRSEDLEKFLQESSPQKRNLSFSQEFLVKTHINHSKVQR